MLLRSEELGMRHGRRFQTDVKGCAVMDTMDFKLGLIPI